MKSKINKFPSLQVLLSLIFLTAGLLAVFIPADARSKTAPKEEKKAETTQETKKESSFTFVGVGDNLIHETLYYFQDPASRDMKPYYQNTKAYTEAADLAYINFETVCAGDEFGLSGYPSFNGPTEIIDAVASQGFDWLSLASNHSMDVGQAGLTAELDYIHNNYPDITTSGSFRTEEEWSKPIVIDVNGIKVGLCTFTYGLNGYMKPEGADWLIDVYRNDDGSVNYDLMKQKLDALQDKSDVQFVSMHWGDEYVTTVTDEQREIADWLNEQGVEVIIGTHPHVIEPVEIIKGEKQDTLCYFSLGNFISAQDDNTRMVGGMADFTLNYDFDSKKTSFSNVKFIPTVTWVSADTTDYRTNTIHEYTDEMGAAQYVTALYGQDMSKQWVKDYVHSVMGDPEGIEIVYD